MKILVISAAFPPMWAGEADHALQLCLRFAERGETVHVLTTKGSMDTSRFPFTVHPLMTDWSWTDLPRLARFINNCRPDAIILLYTGWIYNDHPMITFAPTLTKRLLGNVPFVTQFETEEASYRPALLLLTRAVRKGFKLWAGSENLHYSFGSLLRDSDCLIFMSENHLARFANILVTIKSKSLIIPPPPLLKMYAADRTIARDLGRKKLGLSHEEFLLTFFGYVEQTKGIETLLKAFQIVSRHVKNVRLLMVGGGRGSATISSSQRAKHIADYGQMLRVLEDQLGIADKVVWLQGYTWDSDEASLYLYAADACVLPFDRGVTLSRSSLAAAAAHGLPIITTKGTCLETPFRHEENVLLCPPKDPESLALAMLSLIYDPKLRQRLQEGSAELAHQWFSLERAIDRTIESLNLVSS